MPECLIPLCLILYFSDSFPVSNGVRQGGVPSPILFTINIDDFIDDLFKLGVGCHFLLVLLCYADDLVLLALSPSALRIMLNCCENFATIRGLKFNPSKTQLIRFFPFPSSCCSACFYFCGQQLPFLDTVSHLGHLLHHNLRDVQDVNCKLRDMVRKANCLFATFQELVRIF